MAGVPGSPSRTAPSVLRLVWLLFSAMLRIGGMGLIVMLAVGVWIYAILDSVATDSTLVRHMSKPTWVLVVVLFGPAGALAWLGFGRPVNGQWRPGDTRSKPTPRVIGPEDDPNWTIRHPPGPPAQGPTAAEREARERRRRDRDHPTSGDP